MNKVIQLKCGFKNTTKTVQKLFSLRLKPPVNNLGMINTASYPIAWQNQPI